MAKRKQPPHRILAYLPPATYEKLRRLSFKQRASMSSLIVEAVESYFGWRDR